MEKEKKTISQFLDKHPRIIFWFRFVLWAIMAAVLPFCFIAFRYDLFAKVSTISINLPEILAILIVVIFFFTVLKYIKAGFKGKYSFLSQCLGGLLKITLPLIGIFALINGLKSNIEYFLQGLGCVILCETIAIPLNPLPKWANDKQKDIAFAERKDALEFMIDKIISKKEKQ